MGASEDPTLNRKLQKDEVFPLLSEKLKKTKLNISKINGLQAIQENLENISLSKKPTQNSGCQFGNNGSIFRCKI